MNNYISFALLPKMKKKKKKIIYASVRLILSLFRLTTLINNIAPHSYQWLSYGDREGGNAPPPPHLFLEGEIAN